MKERIPFLQRIGLIKEVVEPRFKNGESSLPSQVVGRQVLRLPLVGEVTVREEGLGKEAPSQTRPQTHNYRTL